MQTLKYGVSIVTHEVTILNLNGLFSVFGRLNEKLQEKKIDKLIYENLAIT